MFDSLRRRVNVRRVAHWEPALRLKGAGALAKLGEPRWLEWVQGDLDDFKRLGESGETCALEPLMILASRSDLGDGTDLARIVAAVQAAGKALSSAKGEGVFEYMVEQLKRGRDAAAGALGELGDPRAVDALSKALGSKKENLAALAAGALGEIGDARAFEALEKAMNRKRSPEGVRACAAASLGQLGDPRALLVLTESLHTARGEVKKGAAAGIAQVGDEGAFRALVEALFSDDEAVREAVTVALAEQEDERAIIPLRDALARAEAEEGSADDASGQPFAKALHDPGIATMFSDRENKQSTSLLTALAKLGDGAAYDRLVQLLCYGDMPDLVSAVSGLALLKDPRSVDDLSRVLRFPEEPIVQQRLKEVEGEEELSGALDYMLRMCRGMAAGALGEVGDERALQALGQAAGDEDEVIAETCREAIEMIRNGGEEADEDDDDEGLPEQDLPEAKPLLALVWFGAGAAIVLFAGYAASTGLVPAVSAALDMRDWTPVPCTITESRVAERERGSVPEIRYTYAVGGTEYTGGKGGYAFEEMRSSEAEARVAANPAGAERSCWVDPVDPAQAVLERDALGGAIVGLFGPCLLLVIGAAVFRNGLYKRWDMATRYAREPGEKVIFYGFVTVPWALCTFSLLVEGDYTGLFGFGCGLLLFAGWTFYQVLAYLGLREPKGFVDLLFWSAGNR